MNFMGYRRLDGKVGIRNHVLVIPAVVCANRVARGIAAMVPGSSWVEHQNGCAQLGADLELSKHVLVTHGTHPNVFGVVIVGLGCETLRAQDVAAEIRKACPYKPVNLIIIQDEGGSVRATAKGASAACEMMMEASKVVREPIPVSELILGTECGGSDACSGISANPALGKTSDILIEAGGSVILAETTELIGAEHIVAARAINKEVSARCFEVIAKICAADNLPPVISKAAYPPSKRNHWAVSIKLAQSRSKLLSITQCLLPKRVLYGWIHPAKILSRLPVWSPAAARSLYSQRVAELVAVRQSCRQSRFQPTRIYITG
jgi:hypothetical protein